MPITDKQITYNENIFGITQITSLIIKKFIDFSEVIDDVYTSHMNTKENLIFERVNDKYRNTIIIRKSNNGIITVKYEHGAIDFSFHQLKIDDTLDHFAKFEFNHNNISNTLKQNSFNNYNLIGNIRLNYKSDSYKIYPKNVNMVINNIKHFEMSHNTKLLHTIALLHILSFQKNTRSLYININEFSKLNMDHNQLLNYKFHQESFDALTYSIETMKENGIMNIRNKAMTLIIAPYNKTVTIKIGGIELFESSQIKKYKYITHHGLNFILNYLQITNTYERLPLMAQKKIFKVI